MPARKARGAIVEKGKKGRKVIGDYLNNLPSTPKQMWEGARPLPHLASMPDSELLLALGLGATLALRFEQADAGRDRHVEAADATGHR